MLNARFEVYCGKKQHLAESVSVDNKAGPAAVARDLHAVFSPGDPNADHSTRPMRLVATDRFYSSVALAIELYDMGSTAWGR